MPTLRALECLAAVLEFGSVTRAAAALHMSQPALSHQLAALEKEIGAPLVERLPRGVRPTVAGRAIAADVRAALSAAERVLAAGRAIARGEEGELRVGCAESMTATLLAPVLRGWRRRYPGLHLALTEATSTDALVRELASGQVDLAIGPSPSHWEGHISLVGEEEVVAVMSRTDPLATATGPVSYARLAEEPLIHYHSDNGLGGWLDSVAAHHGVVFSAVTRTRHAATAAQLAGADLGVALVPTTALPPSFTGAVRHLEPRLVRDVVVLTAIPSDPLVRQFTADVTRRGVPVPKSVSAQLQGPPSAGT